MEILIFACLSSIRIGCRQLQLVRPSCSQRFALIDYHVLSSCLALSSYASLCIILPVSTWLGMPRWKAWLWEPTLPCGKSKHVFGGMAFSTQCGCPVAVLRHVPLGQMLKHWSFSLAIATFEFLSFVNHNSTHFLCFSLSLCHVTQVACAIRLVHVSLLWPQAIVVMNSGEIRTGNWVGGLWYCSPHDALQMFRNAEVLPAVRVGIEWKDIGVTTTYIHAWSLSDITQGPDTAYV